MGQHFKRRRPQYAFTPGQMLQILHKEPKMVALLQHSSIWLAVTPRTAWILDMCCIGQLEGGPETAKDVAHVLGLVLPQPTIPEQPSDDRNQPHDDKKLKVDNQSGVGETHHQEQQDEQQQQLQQEQVTQPVARTATAPDSVSVVQQTDGIASTCQHISDKHMQGDDGSSQLVIPAEVQALSRQSQQLDAHDAASPVQAGQKRRRSHHHTRHEELPWACIPHEWRSVRLTLEETFFLQYVLGCLRVCCQTANGGCSGSYNTAGTAAAAGQHLKTLSDQELWNALRAIRPNFPTQYAGYHHLKCKGWLPRSGLLYGTDYTIYSLHPSATHSVFSVLLIPVHAGIQPPQPPAEALQHIAQHEDAASENGPAGNVQPGSGNEGGDDSQALQLVPGDYVMNDWHNLQITSRVVSTVAKKLLLLYLCEQPNSPGHGTPDCIWHYSVEERVVKRWVPTSAKA